MVQGGAPDSAATERSSVADERATPAAFKPALRRLPGSRRPTIVAVALGTVGGAAVIEPGGVDFTLLEPRWLAVALFVALPTAFGAVLAWGVERAISRVDRRSPAGWTFAILLLPVMPACSPSVHRACWPLSAPWDGWRCAIGPQPANVGGRPRSQSQDG